MGYTAHKLSEMYKQDLTSRCLMYDCNSHFQYMDVQGKRYFHIDKNYFVTEGDELTRIRDIRTKRFLEYWNHRASRIHINYLKMSSDLLSYVTTVIDLMLNGDHRSSHYYIRDMYFNYCNDKHGFDRSLVVVIKHEDKSATEAFYLKPNMIGDYILRHAMLQLDLRD